MKAYYIGRLVEGSTLSRQALAVGSRCVIIIAFEQLVEVTHIRKAEFVGNLMCVNLNKLFKRIL